MGCSGEKAYVSLSKRVSRNSGKVKKNQEENKNFLNKAKCPAAMSPNGGKSEHQ